jgi:hypothetical protein
MWHVWKTEEVHTGFWCGALMEGDHLEDLGIDGSIILKVIFNRWDWEACTGLLWFRIMTGGGRL